MARSFAGEAHKVGGIVLCGGLSTRMGRPKEWLPIGGELLLQRVVRAVCGAVEPVVVASRRGQELPPLPKKVDVVHDAIEDFGPVAGIAAGLDALRERCEAAFVATCDHPFLNTAVIAKLIESLADHPALVVRDGEQLFPLLGVYRFTARPVIDNLISRGEHRARRLAEECGAHFLSSDVLRELDPTLRSLRNVNDPSDLASTLRELETAEQETAGR